MSGQSADNRSEQRRTVAPGVYTLFNGAKGTVLYPGAVVLVGKGDSKTESAFDKAEDTKMHGGLTTTATEEFAINYVKETAALSADNQRLQILEAEKKKLELTLQLGMFNLCCSSNIPGL